MPSATVFYNHPYYGSGQYVVERSSVIQAGRDAADMLPEDLNYNEGPVIGVDGVDADNYKYCVHEYELECHAIRDELDIRVYSGVHTVEPERKPDWEFV